MGSHAYLQNTYAQRNHLEKWVYIQPNLLELVISWPHVLKQRQDFRIHLDWLVLIYTSLEHQKLLISKIWYEMFGCTSASSSSKDILNVAQFWPPSYPSYRRPVWRVWPPYSKSVLEKSRKRLFFFFSSQQCTAPEVCGKMVCPRWLAVNVPYRRKFPSQRLRRLCAQRVPA